MLERAFQAQEPERVADQRAEADLAHQAQRILAMAFHAPPIIGDPRGARLACEEEVAAAEALAGKAVEGPLSLRKRGGDGLSFGEADAEIGVARGVIQKVPQDLWREQRMIGGR